MVNADDHLTSAKVLLEKEQLPHACFHAQQAAEIGLKALFLLNNVPFDFIHSITSLLNSLKDVYPDLGAFDEEAASLTGYAVRTRYPDLETGINPRDTVTKTSAARAVRDAEKILRAAQETYGKAVMKKG